ncbi:hypothetical protein GW891_00395 [bacterium]|nr:hypothetical protein [bacterium]
MFKKSEIINVTIIINILQIIHAIKTQRELINISENFCFLGDKNIIYFLFFKIYIIYKNAPRLIKKSAKLNIEKYLTHMKSITFELKILSNQFQMAHHKINQKLISINLLFFFFSSLK